MKSSCGRFLRVSLTAAVLIPFGIISSADSPPPFYADKTDLLRAIDASGKAQPIKTPADWEVRRRHILAGMELVMGPLPEKFRSLPLDPKFLEEVKLPKFTRRKVTYQADPDDRVAAYLLIPRHLQGKTPAVLCLHQTTEIGKEEPAGLGENTDLRYALELAERGFVTLVPDYWTFGDYRGKTYNPLEHGYASGTMKGIWNHIRSVDYLLTLPEVDGGRIGAIGHSLGGHNTLWLGAFEPRIQAMVSSSGFNSFRAYAASPYGGGNLKNYAQDRYMPRVASAYGNDPKKVPFEWTEVLGALAPRPVFVSAPLRDENFTVEGVRECIRAALPVYELLGAREKLTVVYPDAGHSFPKEVRKAAYEFLEKALRGKRQ